MNLGSLRVSIGVDQSGLTAGLNQAKGQVQSFAATAGGLGQTLGSVTAGSTQAGRALSQGVGAALSGLGVSGGAATRSLGLVTQGLGSLGAAGTTAGLALGVGLVAALVAMGAAAVRASVEFNEAMANVATLIPGNIERVKELKGAVQDLAVATGKSTDDISKGLYQVISAYGDTADTAKSLQLVTEAGIAGLSTTEEALKLVSTQTKAYGDNSLAAQKHVADLDFLTVKLGQTTFPQLAAAMPKVEELSHSLGIRQEEVNAAFAATAGVMGGAERASTTLASAEMSLLRPTTAMKELFKAVGVESGAELVKKLGGFQQSLAFVKATADASHRPLTDFIGRAEGVKAALYLAGEGAKDYAAKLDAMQSAHGTMKAALQEQQHGINEVGADWEKLKQAVSVAAQTMGDSIVEQFGHRSIEALTSFVSWATRAAKAANEWRNPAAKGVQIGADWATRRRELAEAGGREFGDAGLRSFMMSDLSPTPGREAPGAGIKGVVLPDKKALAALTSEQTRYTQELGGATERLSVLLAGEGNIAGQVAARYHLLTEAQRDNLTAVLKQIEHQTQLNAVHAHTESNSRVRALLARGESVEVARLGGQYSQLSTSELRAAFASERATEAAIQASNSRKAYAKDLGTLEAQVRRLKQGQDAEASGVDALKEKYPGLSRAMLETMNNTLQWKKHLAEVNAEAHRVAETIRALQLRILEAGAGSNVEKAAASLFGGKILERGGKPRSARALYEGLDAGQRFQAVQEAGKQAFAGIDEQITQQRQRLGGMVGDVIGGGQGLLSRQGRAYKSLVGPNEGQYLGEGQQDTLYRKAEDLIRLQDSADQAAAAIGVIDQEWAKFNTVVGSSEVNLDILGKQFGVLTGKSATARKVMEQFGVNLKDLPKDAQASVRGIIELQERMSFFNQIAQGTQQVFEGMFTHLYEHGFKGFFKNVIQGFEQMLQQVAAKYLASKLTDLVMGAVGGLFGAAAGAAGGGGGQTSGGAGFSGGGLLGDAWGLLHPQSDLPQGWHYQAPPGADGGKNAGLRLAGMGSGQGRELFVPKSDGRIVPHGELAGAGGGGGSITINMHVSGVSDAESFRKNSGAIIGDLHRRLESRRRRDG